VTIKVDSVWAPKLQNLMLYLPTTNAAKLENYYNQILTLVGKYAIAMFNTEKCIVVPNACRFTFAKKQHTCPQLICKKQNKKQDKYTEIYLSKLLIIMQQIRH
jgi:hypothetical protein